MNHYELIRSIEHWNEYRVPILKISTPDKNLNFQGAMRFYFQDTGQKVATKCVNVTSNDTSKDVIEVLIEKFRPDMRMLSVPEYGLYEIHENGDERKLGPDEKPLYVQLEWNKDDREGRFLLRRMDEKTRNLAAQNEEPSLKRKLSKKEKKKRDKLMKQQQREQEEADAVAAKNGIAEKLYHELPETSFTRSISNPEAVMKRRRAQKLQKPLQEFSLGSVREAGGTLRIFGETINKDVSYKTLLLSTKDTASHVVKQILEKYGKEDDDPERYCLVKLIVPSLEASNGDKNSVHDLNAFAGLKEYILDDSDCPLLINQLHDKSKGILTFHIRFKPADYEKRRDKPLHPMVVHQSNVQPTFKNHQPHKPEIITLKLRKVNDFMGLSIIAARGVGQKRLGIYIRNVVKNGSAAIDGRLQAGDQLLEVDGNSLLDITQEQAAELLMHTGPSVTLTIAKQAAIYHDVSDIINSVPTQTVVSHHQNQPTYQQQLHHLLQSQYQQQIQHLLQTQHRQQLHHQLQSQHQHQLQHQLQSQHQQQLHHQLQSQHQQQLHHQLQSQHQHQVHHQLQSQHQQQVHHQLQSQHQPQPHHSPQAHIQAQPPAPMLPPPQAFVQSAPIIPIPPMPIDQMNHLLPPPPPHLISQTSPMKSPKKVSWVDTQTRQSLHTLIPLPQDPDHHDELAVEANFVDEDEDEAVVSADSLTLKDIDEVLSSKLEDSAGVIGTQEIYNDPRQRIVQERERAPSVDINIEKLSFQEKRKMFNVLAEK